MEVLNQMVMMFIMIAMGHYARKKNIITPANQNQFSGLVLNITLPAIVLYGAMAEGPRASGSGLIAAASAAVLVLALSFLMSALSSRLLAFRKKDRSIVNVMVIFTNVNLMGVPMVRALYGDGALIYIAVFIIFFNLAFFSYGLYALKNGVSEFRLRDLANNGMIASVLAIAIYLINPPVPGLIRNVLETVGSMTLPIAMMLIGSFLVDVKWKALFTDVRMIALSVIKMTVIPVAVVAAVSLFIEQPLILAVCMAVASTPVGTMTPVIARMFSEENYEISMKGVAVTTALSLATMPLCFEALSWIAKSSI